MACLWFLDDTIIAESAPLSASRLGTVSLVSEAWCGVLKGHAWLYVYGHVYREDPVILAREYVVMLES